MYSIMPGSRCETTQLIDPTTGQYFADDESICDDVDVCDASSNCSSNGGSSSNKLSVFLKDLYNTDYECMAVNIAVLCNYLPDKKIDETTFSKTFLPEIKITYDTLTRLFFNDIRKGFSPLVLNKIWKGIKNFPLASVVLDNYESKTGADRCAISPITKVKLYKETAIDKITTISKTIFGLNRNEYNCALGSVDKRSDGKISSTITFNLWFESLSIGVSVIMRFAVDCVPPELIGKFQSEEASSSTSFEFSDESCTPQIPAAEVIFDEDGSC